MSDWDKNTCGVGVPFRSPDGVMMAFNCGYPAFMITRERIENEIGPLLVALVKRVSGSMGRI
jgi:DNA-binding IclR family transcriptional regulator